MRVGTSRNINCGGTELQDHPHACGDKVKNSSKIIKSPGSSPCVWGQDAPFGGFGYCFRIIPMRVGTSSDTDSIKVLKGDHPHACGDK